MQQYLLIKIGGQMVCILWIKIDHSNGQKNGPEWIHPSMPLIFEG